MKNVKRNSRAQRADLAIKPAHTLALSLLATACVLVATQAQSAGAAFCSDAFDSKFISATAIEAGLTSQALRSASERSWTERRDAVVTFLKAHPEVPSFVKHTENGDVPVLMLNDETYSTLKPLLDESVGYGFDMTPGSSDHAILRVENTLMDIGHMGTRRGGELNYTGIAWKELNTILPWRRVMIQNSYVMPKSDRDVARFYHATRRASFFRARYAFSNDWELERVTPNLIEEVSENCFRFCKSDQTPHMSTALDSRLKELLGDQLASIRASASVKEFIGRSKVELLRANPYDSNELNWYTAKKIARQTRLHEILPARLSELQRETVANLLVAERAVADYTQLLSKYRVSDHHGYQDIDAGAVSFTIIMAPMSAAEMFRNGTYEAHGAFFHWLPENQSPLK